MEKRRKLAAPLLIALLVGSGVQAQPELAPGGIIDPGLVGPTDANYAPRFFVGALLFRIPNTFLIFPWPTGQHPFDRSICDQPTIVKDPAAIAICKSDSQSIFMKIPVAGFASDAKNNGGVSLVTLGFHELWGSKWRGIQASVAEFGAERDDRWVRKRIPELDTQKYAAFHDAWTGEYAKQAPPKILAAQAGDYMFISSNKDEPRVLTCQTVLETGDVYRKLRCIAAITFLAERYPQEPSGRYPQEPSGRYPYTITFDLPGTEIDAAAEVGRHVTQAVLAFLDPPVSK